MVRQLGIRPIGKTKDRKEKPMKMKIFAAGIAAGTFAAAVYTSGAAAIAAFLPFNAGRSRRIGAITVCATIAARYAGYLRTLRPIVL